jgi:hypothetical protein
MRRVWPGAEVDDVVSAQDDVQVVFDDQYGGAVVEEPLQDLEEDADVQGVQADGRLVEYEDRVVLGTAEVVDDASGSTRVTATACAGWRSH